MAVGPTPLAWGWRWCIRLFLVGRRGVRAVAGVGLVARAHDALHRRREAVAVGPHGVADGGARLAAFGAAYPSFISPRVRRLKLGLALMPEANTKLKCLLAQRTNRALHLLRNLLDGSPCL